MDTERLKKIKEQIEKVNYWDCSPISQQDLLAIVDELLAYKRDG